MIAGPPGAGKSALALNCAVKARVPTLYISCDMGPAAFVSRVAAIASGATTAETREHPEKYQDVIEQVDHLYVTYPSRPSADDIARAQMAFIEVHGVPSDLMVIDNLMNLHSGAGDEWTGLRDLSQVMHYLANELQICVLVLHHINMGGLDLSYPAPLNYIKGQVTELPAVVLTGAKGEEALRVAAVKNRHGRADSSGKSYFSLDYDEERQILSDPPPASSRPVSPPARTRLEIPDWFSRATKD